MTPSSPRIAEAAPRLSPLNLAGYCTWLAVAAAPLLSLLQGDLPASPRTTLGIAALLVFVLLFYLRSVVERRQGWPAPAARTLILLQLPIALLASFALPHATCAILLIIVAAQCFAYFSSMQALLLMAGANAVLLAILLSRMPIAQALVLWLSFAGFQGFAAMTIAAWRSAEQARAETQRMNAELRATQQLLAEGARAQERLHLSRELHDVAGHKLTALKLQLHLLERRVPGDQASAAVQCRQLVEDLLSDLRAVVSAMRQHDGVDLRQALSAYIETFPSPAIDLDIDPSLQIRDMNRAEILLRCAQEGIVNAVRHSQCRRIVVRLCQAEDAVRLEVEDDGCGVDAPQFGNGLTGLQERVFALAGTLALSPSPQGGARLCVSLPL